MINTLRAKSVLHVFLFGTLNKTSITQFQYCQSPVTDVAHNVLKEWQNSSKKDREEKIGENAFHPDIVKLERAVKKTKNGKKQEELKQKEEKKDKKL